VIFLDFAALLTTPGASHAKHTRLGPAAAVGFGRRVALMYRGVARGPDPATRFGVATIVSLFLTFRHLRGWFANRQAC
jgi:hypothetical protein